MANADRIKHVASIIKAYREKRPVVVLSAMGDTTDHLLEAADKAVSGIVDGLALRSFTKILHANLV